MRKFEIGDRVVCVNSSSNSRVKAGKEYVIAGYVHVGHEPAYLLEGVSCSIGFFEHRFELASGTKTPSSMTDQELADEYRRVRTEANELCQELRNRGYSVKTKDIGAPIQIAAEVCITKTETVEL